MNNKKYEIKNLLFIKINVLFLLTREQKQYHFELANFLE